MKLTPILFVLFFAVTAFGQSSLPDKSQTTDLKDKTKYYLDAEADQAKLIRKALKGAGLIEVMKADDAEFVLEFRILSEKEKPGLGGMFPTSNTVRRGQLEAYYYRNGRKVVVFSDIKEGGGFSRPPAHSLAKRFADARKGAN
jgi:hypothetical protein